MPFRIEQHPHLVWLGLESGSLETLARLSRWADAVKRTSPSARFVMRLGWDEVFKTSSAYLLLLRVADVLAEDPTAKVEVILERAKAKTLLRHGGFFRAGRCA